MAEESNFNQKLRNIMEISYHVQMDRLRECLGIDQSTFNNKILDWAQKFDLSIKGEYICISGRNVDVFLQELETQYDEWLISSTEPKKGNEISPRIKYLYEKIKGRMNRISGIQDPAKFAETVHGLMTRSPCVRMGYTMGNGVLGIGFTFRQKEDASREIARAFLEENRGQILDQFGQSISWEVTREFPRLRLQISPIDLGDPATWNSAIKRAVTQLDALINFLRPCVLELSPECTLVMQKYNGIPLRPAEYEVIAELRHLDPWDHAGEWSRGPFGITAEKGHITALDLSSRDFSELPEDIGNLASLTTLNLSGNGLSTLPDSLGNLVMLKTLDLSENGLNTLPGWLGNLASLAELNLAKNQFSAFPDALCTLAALEKLNLDENKLTALPDCISNMASLQELRLTWNNIKRLPKSLGDLNALRVLDLRFNRINTLPQAVRRMFKEQDVSLLWDLGDPSYPKSH